MQQVIKMGICDVILEVRSFMTSFTHNRGTNPVTIMGICIATTSDQNEYIATAGDQTWFIATAGGQIGYVATTRNQTVYMATAGD